MKNIDMMALGGLTHSPLKNYILAGLESHLIGATTRVFINTRESMGVITPHSHRFDFQCLVLHGSVVNTIYNYNVEGDTYALSELTYLNDPGQYDTQRIGIDQFSPCATTYVEGDWYGMTHDQIHSISFSRDAAVLFIEGRQLTDKSIYIEPHVGGETIPAMKTESWMFSK